MTHFTQEDRRQFQENGYLILRSLFSKAEVEEVREHFFQMHDSRDYPNANEIEPGSPDPLKRYPRIVHPQRWEEFSLRWFTDERLAEILRELFGSEPLGVQSMFYFKPPGARGQALHQDQYYLRVKPGTCIAAWMAVDRCDEENGCLFVVPGSHRFPVLCTIDSEQTESWTSVTVPLPETMKPEAVILNPGDLLFFNGQVVHGSYPNRSTDRFRSSMIAHYVSAEDESVSKFFHPVYRMDGSEIDYGVSEQGAPCGEWANENGLPVPVMTDRIEDPRK